MRENTVRGPAIDLGEFERRLRAPERKETGADPLGELARLIQGEEAAADPYSRILSEPRPSQRAPAPDAGPQLRGSYEEAGEVQQYEDRYIEPTIDHGQEYDPRYEHEEDAARDDYRGAEGGWSDDSHYLDYGREAEPFDEPRGVRRWFRPWHAVAAISLLAIGSIGWGFAHRSAGEASKDIATIPAPEGPVKVKPTAEAEAAAPDTGGAAVLDRKENEPVKQVVTNQEQAVEPTLAPKSVTLGNGPVAAPHDPAPPALPQAKKVKTVTVRPDGTRVDDAEALPPAVSRATRAAPEAAAPLPATTPPAIKPPAPKPVAKPKAPPKAQPKVAAIPADDAPASEAAPANDQAAEPATPLTRGGYAVQFGAATTEAEASALVKSVSAKYGASLGGHRPSFAKATVGDKTVYRVRVGGMSKESAAAVCGKVKSSGGNCFVAGN